MPLESLCIISQSTANSKQSYRPEWLKSGSNWHFFGLCDLEIWLMTLKTSRSRDLIAAAPLSRQRPTFYIWMTCVTLNLDLLIWKWCTAHCPLLGCICTWAVCVPGAMKRTQQKFQMPRVTLTFDPFFYPEMVRDKSSPHGLCVYHIWSESVKQGRSQGADRAKTSNQPCDLDLWPFDPGWCVTHRHLMGCVCTTCIWSDSVQ